MISLLNSGIINDRDLICETLPKHLCSFARCILDASQSEGGNIDYKCKTSNVMVEKLAGHIESDQCMNACSTDRLLTEDYLMKVRSRATSPPVRAQPLATTLTALALLTFFPTLLSVKPCRPRLALLCFVI
ncbi:hypothetical protein Sango_2042900 [Sesamum angolense]|uniref:PAR1 protein n=1 Tax=Sesamum angolense TaxID=2727404 RepID=A0AAE1WG01_9LAMI|nr:hypothetical protein Sango_2042900 [Sesamum angolense]